MSNLSELQDVNRCSQRTDVGSVPVDWDVRAVKEMGQVITGKALAVNGPGMQRPYLRTKNVYDGRIDISDVLTMPMTDAQFAQFRVEPGDVLLNEGQSIELVGRCALYSGEFPEPCAIQNQLLRFRARDGVSSRFASYLFRHAQQTGVFARIALQTTSIAHLGGSRFERLRLAWPRSEQEQIAIANALSDVDALLGSLDRLIAKKRDIKQAAMQQLLTGRTRLPGFRQDWQTTPLCKMAKLYQPMTIAASDFTEFGFPVYGANGIVGYYHTFNHDTPQVTVTCRGSTCGTVNFTQGKCWITGNAMVVNCDGNEKAISKNFLYYRLLAEDLSKCITGTGQPQIVRGPLSNVELKVPADVMEQTSIAEVFMDMDTELTALEQRRDKTRLLKQAMMQELLTGRTRLPH